MTDTTQDDRWVRRANRAPHRLEAAEIERITGLRIENADGFQAISGLSTLGVIGDQCLVFRDRFHEDDLEAINAFEGHSALLVLPVEYRGRVRVPALFLDTPRDAFIPLVAALYDYFGTYWQGYEDGPTAQARHAGTMLMPGCFVHPSAQIGAGTMIFPGAIVGPRVTIGRNALIKPNAVIGMWGFGIHVDANRTNVHLPHVGGVMIGDDVEIGSVTTVCSGTVHATFVGDNVKMDDHVHVAHNVRIGRGAQITACAEISGSAVIDDHSFLAPNCSIANNAVIGSGSIVGLGSAVLKDVPARKLVVGNPSRIVRDLPG